MKHYSLCRVGTNKNAPRIWLEGSSPDRGGFKPGTRYTVTADKEKTLLILEVQEQGVRIVSGKKRGDKEIPVIDLNSQELLSIFAGIETVRVIVQEKKIFILPVASEWRAKERLARLSKKMSAGEPLLTASVSSGIGILDDAVHEGLSMAGIKANLAFANEIREDCMEHAAERNGLYTENTILLTAPMQELVFDQWAMSQLPEVDVMAAGIPCSGASVAGRTKGKLAHPESHAEVGHLVVAFLAIIAKVNPAVILFENVIPYRSSASMDIMRNQLRDLGYDVHETDLDAAEWSMLEHRKRMCMVAVTKGIEFSFDALEKPQQVERTFGEIMDAVDPDHSTWGSIDYLWNKLERDKADGKGFSPTVVDAHSTKVPTLNKTLHKRQSTGTYIRHPVHENLYRIPTVREHARCKGINPSLVDGTTQTFGHEVLGQAISVPPFMSVAHLLGKALKAFSGQGMSSTNFVMPSRMAA